MPVNPLIVVGFPRYKFEFIKYFKLLTHKDTPYRHIWVIPLYEVL